MKDLFFTLESFVMISAIFTIGIFIYKYSYISIYYSKCIEAGIISEDSKTFGNVLFYACLMLSLLDFIPVANMAMFFFYMMRDDISAMDAHIEKTRKNR